jgi:TolB-like protein
VAWYHGDRGEQRVSAAEFAILTVLLLLGGGIFWRYDVASEAQRQATVRASTAATTAPVAVAADVRPSIAVLPFVDMSQAKDQEYFADGISEELLNVLVRVNGLGVASRTSSFGYKGSELGTAAIARALDVNHVLEGSVRKSGNRVRITAQLIDAVHDRHLWSETYDRELTDIFAIQEEIANSIVAALRGTLGAAKMPAGAVTVHADTQNVSAYEQYLKARELFINRATGDELKESLRLFEQVTQMDPGFARAWEGLAAVSVVIESWGVLDRDYMTLARRAADRALELDGSLSMPWAVQSRAMEAQWPVDWSRSLDLSRRAIAADPRNATAWFWRGVTWMQLGYFDKAIEDLDHCLKLERRYPNALRHKAVVLLFARQEDAALDLFERGVADDFFTSFMEVFIGPLVARGNTLAAHFLLSSLEFPPVVRGILLDSLRTGKMPGKDAMALVERFMSDKAHPERALLRGHVYLWMGDFDAAGAVDDRRTSEFLAWERYPAGFRHSAGFKHKMERTGVVAYWRNHGFPPQCRALGTTDFACD